MIKPDTSFNVLYISNVQSTHDFYKSLGCDIKQLEDKKVVVKLGSFDLHFCMDNDEPLDEYQFATTMEGRGQGVLFYVEVDDLDKIFEKAKSAGGTLRSEIRENHWDCKEFMVEDPDGYKIVFWSC